jgi:hypothetical protein
VRQQKLDLLENSFYSLADPEKGRKTTINHAKKGYLEEGEE